MPRALGKARGVLSFYARVHHPLYEKLTNSLAGAYWPSAAIGLPEARRVTRVQKRNYERSVLTHLRRKFVVLRIVFLPLLAGVDQRVSH
jgi:hypothetical protein